MTYQEFLSTRLASAPTAGFAIKEQDLHPSLFPFQKHAVAHALRLGRAAMFEDTGLGKSRQILEWMRHVCAHTGGRTLLLVPLAVAHQFVYLHQPVDSRCSPLAYEVWIDDRSAEYHVGYLIFGRSEATRCYDGKLTYGSLKDVQSGKAQYDRWKVLNLARVWLHSSAQVGGAFCRPEVLPGYYDRRGNWRSTLASTAIEQALARVGYDYLSTHPPCFPDEPYQIEAILSYCDLQHHKGTIYRAAGFELARTNERGIETWFSRGVAPLTPYQNDQVLKLAGQSERSRRHRAQRAAQAEQEVLW
jgi:hypothetical protein